MDIELTGQQKEQRSTFRSFAQAEILPYVAQYDQEERLPVHLISRLAQQGYFGALIPGDYGGLGMNMITYGLLNEEIGYACSSVRSLLTVHTMVSQAILRWGNTAQKALWLPRLASGEIIAAFALTEPDVGSDAKSVETSATLNSNDTYSLNGQKKWITYGQDADLFLVFAQCQGKPGAFLVEKTCKGLLSRPIPHLLGTRASLVAELQFDNCTIAATNLLGRIGYGISHIASYALHYGRYSVAWGCIGIIEACLQASLEYSSKRKQFGTYLKNHQLIRQLITDMVTHAQAARLLCYQAGYLAEQNDPRAIAETSIAKYFAAKTAVQSASNAVQIHGANGCGQEYPVQRYLRDAKIMEIIEGSSQMHQLMIADYAYQEYSAREK